MKARKGESKLSGCSDQLLRLATCCSHRNYSSKNPGSDMVVFCIPWPLPWQYFPSYFRGLEQVHWTSFVSYTGVHAPPFLQGFCEQGLCGESDVTQGCGQQGAPASFVVCANVYGTLVVNMANSR